MEIARGIQVPLTAETVVSPEIRYCMGADEANQMTCLIFWLNESPGYIGRVTFEGFDAIRCCRGEYMPYEDDWTGDDYGQYPWVWEIDNSSWLQQRHKYEIKHYETPLLEEYVHYLFSFHDEFVELIAKGIWFEKLPYEEAGQLPVEHPLTDLPATLAAEHFSVAGIECQVCHNPLSPDDLIEQSELCSQTVFQYYMTLDGKTEPSYAALVRTIRGITMTRLRGGLFYGDRLEVEGVGRESRFRGAFEEYVAEVAERRRLKGRQS